MSNAMRVARQGGADVQRKSTESDRDRGHNVQLKQSLAGMDFARQEAALTPEGAVQMKENTRQQGWTLEELGTAGGQEKASGGGGGGEQKGGAAPVGPSPEQLVQDAFTLGGKSRYQVSAQEAMQWLEEQKSHARPEHKHAFQQAIQTVNKRL